MGTALVPVLLAVGLALQLRARLHHRGGPNHARSRPGLPCLLIVGAQNPLFLGLVLTLRVSSLET